MALTRWEPFEGLASLRREMDRLFEHFFERTPAAMLDNGGTFEPAIEIADIDVLPMAQARGFLGKHPQDFKVDLLGHKTGGLATVQSSGPAPCGPPGTASRSPRLSSEHCAPDGRTRSTFYVQHSSAQRPMVSWESPTVCGNGHHLLRMRTV
jgi:hypothetical protein